MVRRIISISRPNLPITIETIRIIWPRLEKFAVLPVLKPVVLIAETFSKMMSLNSNSDDASVIERRIVVKIVKTTAVSTIVRAFATRVSGISRSRGETLVFLRMVVKIAMIIIARVPTLIPPATDPAAPPTNIRAVNKILVACLASSKPTAVSPAVRLLVASKIETMIFCSIGR